MFAKFWSTIFIALFFLMTANVSFAAPQEISAEGEYRLGDRDSRETAKMAALADAKRKIIEQVGVYVESYSEVNKFQLTQDQIRTAANAMIKLKSEEINFYENGTLCKAFVVATVDTDGENIKRFIDTVMPGKTTPQTENNSVDRKKVLELGGFKEFNGHYYKIFDEGMTWQQAKKRCEEIGGHLATITSKEEQAVIQNLLFLHGHKNYYWLGGVRDKKNIDKWTWVTGEEFSYLNWSNRQPDNAQGVQNVIILYKSSNNLYGKWDDLQESGNNGGPYRYYDIENSGFVCEWTSYDDIKI